MEKEAFFGNSTVINWQKQAPDAAASLPKPNSGHLNLIWDQTIDQSAKFGSALSSLVSSPSSNPPAAAAGGDSVVIRELIGRLGSICNSDEISASPHHRSANNSCYSTPMNSPPKLNLSIVPNPAQMPFSTDAGFVERAARCSTFGCNGGGSHGGGQFMFPVVGKLGNAQDESSGSGNTKKRKAAMKAKGKEAPLSSSITAVTNPPKKAGVGGLNAKTPKRSKPLEETGIEKEPADAASKKIEEDKGTKPPEVTKDYIHVRARRGQATDSHSLAERVRREKISERMKLLQDLVPGCSKVTGKAVMLDEIINYVQLLQRQVEFLSMKLATVNPQLDFNLENFVTKDMEIQNCALLPPQTGYPLEATSNSYSFANQTDRAPLISINGLELESQVNHFSHHPNLSRNSLIMQQPPLEGFADTSCQLGAFWDDDLRTVVQMGFSQNQGSVSSSHMEVGL